MMEPKPPQFTSLPPNPCIRIFCDFDGTVVPEDVGDAFFESFSGPEIHADNALLQEGKLTSRESFNRHTSRIQNINLDRIEEFCSRFDVDPSFHGFLQWAASMDCPVVILSDGLDVYINLILQRAGLGTLHKSNHFVLNADGSCSVDLPYEHPDCPNCGNCKCSHMLTMSGDKDYIVYVGDGYSDFCAAGCADLVFARGSLESFCQKENISYRRFFSFADVQSILTTLLAGKKLRRPHQAAMKRKAIWMSG
jgi:2-hydroxy-3-keto-5-methylthiopentenyl-1-phosphate phosphatase